MVSQAIVIVTQTTVQTTLRQRPLASVSSIQ